MSKPSTCIFCTSTCQHDLLHDESGGPSLSVFIRSEGAHTAGGSSRAPGMFKIAGSIKENSFKSNLDQDLQKCYARLPDDSGCASILLGSHTEYFLLFNLRANAGATSKTNRNMTREKEAGSPARLSHVLFLSGMMILTALSSASTTRRSFANRRYSLSNMFEMILPATGLSSIA